MINDFLNKLKNGEVKVVFLFICSIVAFIIVLTLSFKLVENTSADEIVINQIPITGELEFWVTPGWHSQKFGDLFRYDKAFQIWYSSKPNMGSSDDESIKIVFNDAGIGYISGSAKIILPVTKKYLELILIEYGSMKALVNDLIMPTINKVIFSSGPLMSSFESYAVKKNDLIRYIEDQLQNGIYKTISQEVKKVDELSGKEKMVTVAELIPDSNSPGGFKRQEIAPFIRYGIKISNVVVDDIVYEDKIMKQISSQQTAYMEVQTAIANTKKAKQETIRAEEEGKRNYATAKWEQEKENAKLISEAEKNKKIAELDMQKAKFQKQADILAGEGIARKKKLIMQADGALKQKLEAYVEVNKLYADAISNYKGNWVPSTLISNGKGNGRYNGAQDLINMLTIKTAKDLDLKANPSE